MRFIKLTADTNDTPVWINVALIIGIKAPTGTSPAGSRIWWESGYMLVKERPPEVMNLIALSEGAVGAQ